MPWNCFRSSAKKKKRKKRKDKGADSDHGEQEDKLLPSAEKHTIINAFSTGAENRNENDINIKKTLVEKNGFKKSKKSHKSVVIVESSTVTGPGDVYLDAKTCNDKSQSSRKSNKKNKSKKCFANDKNTLKIAEDSPDTHSNAPNTTSTPTSDINSSSSSPNAPVTAASELSTRKSNEADLTTGCRSRSPNENAHESNLDQSNDKNIGNYDEIPFDLEKRNKGVNNSPDDEPSPLHICEDKEGSPTSDGTVSSGYSSPSRTIPSEPIFEPAPNHSSISPPRPFPKIANHNFQIWTSRKGKRCQLCHDPFGGRAVAFKCSHCDLTCHEWCQDLVKSHNDHSMDHEERQYTTMPKSQSFPVTSQYRRSPADSLRLHYVTQRILASVLPKRELNHQEINGDARDKYEKDIVSMLEQKHGKNYRIFDLESCISVITLERICELCKHIDSWLGDGQEKVVVLQDREDRQRLGTAIAAYLEYLDICSSNYTVQNRNMNDDASIQSTIERNWLDLDIFSMKKFLEDFVGPLKVPSHRRYLRYFSGLLSGKIRMNSSPLYLKRVAIESPPTWMHYDSRLTSQSPEWVTFIKIYEGLRCIYTSNIHKIPMTTRQFLYEIGNLRLRGDIMIRCYQIVRSEKSGGFHQQETRELLYSLQFHTCALTENEIIYGRNDLDLACDDPRFPSDHKITLHVRKNPSDESSVFFQSPMIRTTTPTEIARYDSLESDLQSSCHTQGPIDGSLYATILKSPKSPQTQSYTVANTSRQFVHQQQEDSTGQFLLSPPAQFSNQNLPVPPPRHNSVDRSATSSSFDIIERNVVSSIPATGGVNTKDLHNSAGQRSSSQPPSPYVVDTRPSTSQSNYSTATNHKYSVPVNFTPSETRNITIVETYNSAVDAPSASNPGYSQQVNRDYAPSPLTLSMDSGISSSGVLNRPHQGSSVSPSSFPSQASPQEDRHRELDDILSDMLMTVQDIPDFGKSSGTPQPPQRHPHYHMVRSQSVIPTSGNYAIPSQLQQPQSQYSTIRRSQSYVIEQPGGNYQHHPATYIPRDRQDFYDTSSTTTTLTPPPSESGRDTPIAVYSNSGNTSNYSTLQYHREKRETIAPTSHQHPQHQRQDQQQQQQQQLIMSVQRHQQSSLKPHQERTEVTTEEDEIPYHAREHSQPFSYGSVPPYTFLTETPSEDPAMIKAQSGLSSPSLVRKHLGRSPSPSSSSAQRKTAQRVDFEDMLRDRREKVMNEKYSISDRGDLNNAPSAPRSYGSESQWSTSSTLNRYQSPYQQQDTFQRTSYEPIRRSNTMDGFHRSISTDGISGQTWLQMQQQKLRAKKDQQHRDDRRYFEEVIHTEIRNRPLRNRVARFDGYSSDTAAFADEVDYRRPLQIQTPYNRNRLPDDIYQSKTISTTTTTTKERPFVAVKRAHEQAKQSAARSPPLSPLTMLNASPNGHISHIQNQQHQQQQHSNGLLSMANSPSGHTRLVREESFSSYRSETDPEVSIAGSPRPETPAFPVTPRTPYGLSSNGNVSPALPPKSPTSLRRLYNSTWSLRSQKSSFSSYDLSKDLYSGNQKGHLHEVVNQNDAISCYASRRNSNTSNANSEPQEVAPHLVKFVRDSSKYWYKPNISREEAVALLRRAEPGTFIVRDSTTFKNAFGLVLRVAHPPPGVELRSATGDELVRHFLVEPTTRGVRLKGCNNEPVFSSLSALVYQHSIMPLALPCRLIIPDQDIQSQEMHSPAQRQLLALGAACNVLYLYTCETESLTGEEAIRKAVSQLFACKPLPIPTEVHFKAAQQGVTLTDNTRQKFFRKHYPGNSVSYCGLDPDKRTWSIPTPGSDIPVNNKTIFAFVARRTATSKDNQCHVFCDLQSSQPALAIVSFVNKVLPTDKQVNHHI